MRNGKNGAERWVEVKNSESNLPLVIYGELTSHSCAVCSASAGHMEIQK